jgi:hypothetical protein
MILAHEWQMYAAQRDGGDELQDTTVFWGTKIENKNFNLRA